MVFGGNVTSGEIMVVVAHELFNAALSIHARNCAGQLRVQEEWKQGTYAFRHGPLVAKVARHALDQLDLLIRSQTVDGRLHDRAKVSLVHGDEGVVVNIGEEAHDELAVHAVSDATVARNRVAKVLNFEGALETGSEETSEGCDQRCKGTEEEGVDLNGHDRNREFRVLREEEILRERVGVGEEDGVRVTLEAAVDVGTEILGMLVSGTESEKCSTYIHRADKVLGT